MNLRQEKLEYYSGLQGSCTPVFHTFSLEYSSHLAEQWEIENRHIEDEKLENVI